MKKGILTALLGLALLAGLLIACGNSGGKPADNTASAGTSETTFKKYDIKSGIISFDSQNDMLKDLGLQVTSKVYFDDFGKKEVRETYTNGVLENKAVNDGTNFYQISYKQKAGSKSKGFGNGTEMRFEPENFRDKDIQQYNIKKLANMTIAGKDCQVFTMQDQKAKSFTKYAGWNHITLLIETEQTVANQLMKVTNTATKIEENAAIPASVYEIPKDFTIQEN